MLRADIGEICQTCHSRQSGFGLGELNTTGNHPQGSDPAKLDRKGVPLKLDPAFTTPYPAPYPLLGGRTSVGAHWDLGGHLSAAEVKTIACITCHAVHGDERTPPRTDLLAVDPVRARADLFCEGCHVGERGDAQAAPPHPNPGGTTTGRTYHPADDDRANGVEGIVGTRNPEKWPLGTAASRPIICSTCHSAHGAAVRTLLLRRPAGGLGFCEVCHETLPLEYHHPRIEKGLGRCSAQIEMIDPVTGIRRTCELCHKAHNAGLGTGRETEYIPLLRASRLSDELCLRCHPAGNPTCGERPDYQASHFLGDPTLPETFQDLAPPYRLTPWPESKITSLYGGDKGQIMICLSCHTFRPGAVISGDDGKSRFLVARSGNSIEWADDEGVYLCTGCHGAAPGTGPGEKGHTHPLMEARMETLGRESQFPITNTLSGHINCDSCHRPHEARTGGGYYIMEIIDSPNKDPRVVHPPIDFTSVCHSCHLPGKY
jgi:predicted CXXCH cytochrome family protein